MTYKFPTNKSPGRRGFTGKLYQTFREELIPTLLKFLQKFAKEGMLSNSFYETIITLILKPEKDTTEKITKKENYRSVLLMNIDTKVLNRTLANQIQQCTKRIINQDELGFIPGIQGFFNICTSISVIHHIKKPKNKNHISI